MSIMHLLRSDGFLTVNKYLAKLIGLNEAILLSELLFRYNAHMNNLDSEGMFYCTVEVIEDNTTLSKYQQSKAISTLESHGLIKTKMKGLPARRYFSIYEDAISALFANKESRKLTTDNGAASEPQKPENPHGYQKSKNLTTGGKENSLQEVKKLDSNKEVIINKELLSNDDDDKRVSSISKVYEQFKSEIDRERFDRVVERVSKMKTTDFEACLFTSVQNEIANLQSSATKQDKKEESSKRNQSNRTYSRKPSIEIVQEQPSGGSVTMEELEELRKLARKLDGGGAEDQR